MKIINILLNYQLYFKKFAVLRQLHVAMMKLFGRQCSTMSRQENQKKQENKKKLDKL